MFMKPNVVKMDVVEVDTRDGSFLLPIEYLPLEVTAVTEITAVHTGQWIARLSAPGYMDCTDWMGPFDSEEEALEELFQIYSNIDETLDEWREQMF
jgi:hypothetical protein